ncbi:hypothetical protein DUNSADRAFT_13301 [Dunaliella salina]|uniref:Uncharacterized protein n=1 Tax=Dunaliella salina TaxID=3046 RepID=A0ABQ7G9Q6_DUNSA|nr:hypothetical protein DUNSADRAFT_13301 [Dunaliella salina]|eukprot:KAF5831327.1 hypothetical protein DUNSADRAFT_13301 [Dunaliella salina]
MGCCGQCFRAIIYIFCLPFLLILSVFGMLIWLVLQLFACICSCCAPCACAAQAAASVMNTIVKAPFKMAMWVGDKAA